MKYLAVNIRRVSKTCVLKTTKHYWEKLKRTEINGVIYYMLLL